VDERVACAIVVSGTSRLDGGVLLNDQAELVDERGSGCWSASMHTVRRHAVKAIQKSDHTRVHPHNFALRIIRQAHIKRSFARLRRCLPASNMFVE
jgi:hypothetical protein